MTSNAATAHNLVLGYGPTVAISASTFTIPLGRITAVIGPNGSGKSTLLSALTGIVKPVGGTIDTAMPPDRIAYVLQTTKVNDALPISAREVVAMGRYSSLGMYQRATDRDRQAVLKAMDRMQIRGLASRHLQHLSGGQRQRVFVAQGLAQEHDMLLLDEPLSGVDITAAQAIDSVIHDEMERGCTVVMTTHDISEARFADHVILLSERVVAFGAPEDVITRENLIAAYGPNLLHVDDGQIFLDDPAHIPVPGTHAHRDRTSKPESGRHT